MQQQKLRETFDIRGDLEREIYQNWETLEVTGRVGRCAVKPELKSPFCNYSIFFVDTHTGG